MMINISMERSVHCAAAGKKSSVKAPETAKLRAPTQWKLSSQTKQADLSLWSSYKGLFFFESTAKLRCLFVHTVQGSQSCCSNRKSVPNLVGTDLRSSIVVSINLPTSNDRCGVISSPILKNKTASFRGRIDLSNGEFLLKIQHETTTQCVSPSTTIGRNLTGWQSKFNGKISRITMHCRSMHEAHTLWTSFNCKSCACAQEASTVYH